MSTAQDSSRFTGVSRQRYIHFDANDDYLRDELVKKLVGYVVFGDRVGGFLEAALKNQFVAAASRADNRNAQELQPLARWIYSHVPDRAWGNEKAVQSWHGLNTVDAHEAEAFFDAHMTSVSSSDVE